MEYQDCFSDEPRYTVRSLGEMRKSYGACAVPCIVDGLLPEGALIIAAGETKCGKSTLLANLAVNVALGDPWLGRTTKRGPVLWFAYEESAWEWLSNFEGYEATVNGCIHVVSDAPPIDTQDGLASVVALINDYNPSLVIIDPLSAATADLDFDHTGAGRSKLQGLKRAIGKANCACIVVHHLTKGTSTGSSSRRRISGSHQLLATASGDWVIEAKRLGDSRILTVSILQRIFGACTLRIESRNRRDFRSTGTLAKKNPKPSSLAMRVEEHLRSKGPSNYDELCRALGKRIGSLSKVASRLVKSGLIEVFERDDFMTFRLKESVEHRASLVLPEQTGDDSRG